LKHSVSNQSIRINEMKSQRDEFLGRRRFPASNPPSQSQNHGASAFIAGFGLAPFFHKILIIPRNFRQAPNEATRFSIRLAMPQIFDTKSGKTVGPCGHQIVQALARSVAITRIDRVFADLAAPFSGRHPDYLAIDLRYHDLEHTVQATACPDGLLASRHRAEVAPMASARQFELTKFLCGPNSKLLSAAPAFFGQAPSRVGSTLTSSPPRKTVRCCAHGF
jgi:hypothetical protein